MLWFAIYCSGILCHILPWSCLLLLSPQLTLDELLLDLNARMSVSAATAGGQPTNWSHMDDVLSVTLDRVYIAGESVTVTVSYGGDPAGEGPEPKGTVHVAEAAHLP